MNADVGMFSLTSKYRTEYISSSSGIVIMSRADGMLVVVRESIGNVYVFTVMEFVVKNRKEQ